MNNEYDYMLCVFNRRIDCSAHDKCENCGWNPVVEQKRKEAIREKRKVETNGVDGE